MDFLEGCEQLAQGSSILGPKSGPSSLPHVTTEVLDTSSLSADSTQASMDAGLCLDEVL